MPFVTTKETLEKAEKEKYAIGAFNAENMEMAQAIIAAAEKMGSPVIVQTTPGTLRYAPPAVFAGMVRALAERSPVPVSLHLDHGNSIELVKECIKCGYTSVMIDGSLLPFEENVEITRGAVLLAGDIPVEAELGTVGGKEDGHAAGTAYTDPDQAEEFVRRTGVFSFAPAIGTAHGIYKEKPRLDLDRLTSVASRVSVPLVLHGTSGVPDDTVRECIARGIRKVNYATDLRAAFTGALRSSLAENAALDPKKHLAYAREAVEKRVCELMAVCGCAHKA